MADRSDISYHAGEGAGQAQVKKDELVDRASEACQHGKERATEACQHGKEQAGGFIQHTAEQVRDMAQNAAGAVKDAVGMGDSHRSD